MTKGARRIDVRERLTDGELRARTVRELRQDVRSVVIGMLGLLLAAGGFLWLVSKVERTRIVSSKAIAFEVDDASGVQSKIHEVRFRGVPAGRIVDVKLEGARPVLRIDFESEFGPIYRNARAALRPNTPLQDMYLNILDRGTPDAGIAGVDAPVPMRQTDTAVQIGEVLDVFQGNTRARLAHLLDGLGRGLDDRGERLTAAFVELLPLVRVAGRITDQLDRNAPLTKRLVHNAGVLTTELGRREAQLRRLVEQSGATLQTLQASQGSLDRSLRELPPTLTAADGAFTAVRGVLGDLDGALTSLQPVAARLPDSLRSVRALTARATPAVRALETPVEELVPLARVLRPLSKELSTSIGRLLPQVPSLERTVDVVTRCRKELNGFMQWDASMAKFGDSRGPAPRGNAVFGAGSGGLESPWEHFPQVCAPGKAIGGRPAKDSDHR